MTRATRVSQLPITEVMGAVLAALDGTGVCVLAAPPGTGKTTGVPLALLDASWLGDRRIVMARVHPPAQ